MEAKEERLPWSVLRRWTEWILALGVIFSLDKILAIGCKSMGWSFPSSIIGLGIVVGLLSCLSVWKQEWNSSVYGFMQPALDWIQQWLPLFYLPPLVNLPYELQGLSTTDLLGLLLIVLLGWGLNLWVSVRCSTWVRSITKTNLQDRLPTAKPSAIPSVYFIVWGSAGMIALPILAFSPFSLATTPRIVFSLSMTVCGFLLGNFVYKELSSSIHPVVTCAIVAHIAAGLSGLVEGNGWIPGVGSYLSKDPTILGAGNIFMAFLGCVVVSFGFHVFAQRVTMMHHIWEILAGIISCSIFSMFSTAVAGRLLGLPPKVILAVVPRSVTVALALPIAEALGSNLVSVTAGAVVLTGLIGANFSSIALNWLSASDPIVRGVASASCGHGLATGAMGLSEPDTLAFCSLSYALSGIFSTLLLQIPFVCQIIRALAGEKELLV